ncbi:MAG TPA: thiolase family protein [Acidimicrobiales bacterium]|nr:thiolase family protein [Acidimicrobiales bacterium]
MATIAGVGMTAFGRFPERSLTDLATEASLEALSDARVELRDVQCVYFSNALAGILSGQECIRGEVFSYSIGLDGIPVINVENACASGGTALHQAFLSIAAEEWDCILVVGAEKMYHQVRDRVIRALMGAMDIGAIDVDSLPMDRSPFIDVYAERARRLMKERGVTSYGLACIAAKAWLNGSMNPKAQRVTPISAEEIMEARLLVEPLTVPMCSLIGDGAAAAVVTSGQTGTQPGVRIRASQLRTLAATSGGKSATKVASNAAYEAASVDPSDVGMAEVHDATAVGEMTSWVDLGLCPAGDEEKWATTGHTAIDGPLPVNPSGGLLARGHPLGASGVAQAYEVVKQLRGQAGERQVERRSSIALTQVGGGSIDDRTAVSAVHLFEYVEPRN